MHFGRWYSVLLGGLLLGCKYESSVTLRSSCFDACVDASANVDIEGQLAIATDIRNGLESARAGLSGVASVSNALTQFVQSMVDMKSGMPSGLSYAGAGVYKFQPNTDASVELRFYLPSNTSYGKAGDLIQFNLFDASNYFTSLGVKVSTTVSLSGISATFSFTFDNLGPGAELLGIGSSASSPIPVDVNAFSSQLSKVVVQAKVDVAHASNASRVELTLSPAEASAGAAGSTSTQIDIENFKAENGVFDQTVTLESAALSFSSSSGKYEGALRAKSMSPDFGFTISIGYDVEAQGDIQLGCLGASL